MSLIVALLSLPKHQICSVLVAEHGFNSSTLASMRQRRCASHSARYDNAEPEVDEDDPGKKLINVLAWMQKNAVFLIAGVIAANVGANVVPITYN